MADARSTIVSHRNLLERLTSRIPGFRGYHDAEERREADHLLRGFGVAELERIASRLHEHKRAAPLQALQPLEDVLIRVETLRNELRYAERGYSGFFDEVKWDRPELLDELYERDEQIVERIEALGLAVEERQPDPAGLLEALAGLRRSVEERQRSILRSGSRGR